MATDGLHSHPPDRVRGRPPRGSRRDVRRADLPEGRRRPAHARAVPRARARSATASASTSTAHRYGNTETADLWDAIETASGEPVRSIMDSWILQGGYPLVTLDSRGMFRQRPFSYRPAEPGEASSIGGPWEVPVMVRTLSESQTTVGADGQLQSRFLLGPEPRPGPPASGSSGSSASGQGEDLVNAGGWGFYRVSYPSERLSGLGARWAELTTLERANLLSDSWALVLADQAPIGDFFGLGSHLQVDDDPASWGFFIGGLAMADRVGNDADRSAVVSVIHGIIAPAMAQLGWSSQPGEPERRPTLRGMLLRTLGTIGADEAVRAEAAGRFKRSFAEGPEGGEPMDPNLESAILDTVAAAGRSDDYERFLARYRNPATPQEENRYLYALAAFEDRALARRTFDLVLSEVRSQNGAFVVHSLLRNRVAGTDTWEAVKAHWHELLGRIPTNTASRMLEGVRSLCTDGELVADITTYLTSHPLTIGQRSVLQTLEHLKVNHSFALRQRGHMDSELAAIAPPSL